MNSSLEHSIEKLRLSTSRLIMMRLNLPHPGTLMHIKKGLFFHKIMNSDQRIVIDNRNLLTLICVNTQPPTPRDFIDPIEFVFMNHTSNGSFAISSDWLPGNIIMNKYEILLCFTLVIWSR